ncbi:hypothetical protein K0M31_003951 [Melipona bicolor]|uniref:Uncharacterized protein n=1 Tax=Melipona bicolor TaxID=60889 RepID=A0AA40KP39_9HYME|nr:hypothetical protein K0M31_003951 [Melipona bicolor]
MAGSNPDDAAPPVVESRAAASSTTSETGASRTLSALLRSTLTIAEKTPLALPPVTTFFHSTLFLEE